MHFFRKASTTPTRVGILPGTFNPITVAHLALAGAALTAHVDEVVFVLPRVFPHKDYSGASFEERVAMLTAAASHPAYSVATSDGGLYIDIVREARALYGPGVELLCLCGRDAAERIAGWDYGRPGAFPDMLSEFGLLVADRDGSFEPPAEIAHAVHCVEVTGTEAISATQVRERALSGAPWEHLVPLAARPLARRIYTRRNPVVSE
jgi:nicotinate (nicotinamide) nucleotide adenylyltransferase